MDDLMQMPLSTTTLLSVARDHTINGNNNANANTKKRSHRRTLSVDSNDSSCCSKDSTYSYSKAGKARRKIQWSMSMKDLLSSTSLMTIDGASSVASAEETCATEATVSSPTSYCAPNSQSQNQAPAAGGGGNERECTSTTTSSINKLPRAKSTSSSNKSDQDATLKATTLNKPKQPLKEKIVRKPKPVDVAAAVAAMEIMNPRRKATQRKLVPRISHSILQRRSKEPLVLPSTTTSKQQQQKVPSTKSTRPPRPPSNNDPMKLLINSPVQAPRSPANKCNNNAAENEDGDESLTPLTPMRLSFEYGLASPKVMTMDCFAHAPMNIEELDLATIFDEQDDEAPASATVAQAVATTPSTDISVVHLDRRDGPMSPLTPSPTQLVAVANRPHIEQHRKPRPFVLERILSESNCAHPTNTNNEEEEDDDMPMEDNAGAFPKASDQQQEEEVVEPTALVCTEGQQEQAGEEERIVAYEFGQESESIDFASTSLAVTVTTTEPMDESEFEFESTNNYFRDLAYLTTTSASKPTRAPERLLFKAKSEPVVTQQRPASTLPKRNLTSMRSMRTIRKSVPVDVDDVKFVDIKNNLETIEAMAEEHLQQGEFGEALDVYKEILRSNLEQNGYEHESVGATLHIMAATQLKRKNYTKAVQISHKAIYVRKMALGREHPDVAISLVQLGMAFFEKEEYTSALEVFQEALIIRRKSLGPDHLKVSKVLNNIGCAWKQLRNNGEAIMAFEEAVQLQKHAINSVPNDVAVQLSISIASSLSNICTVKLSLGLVHEALMALDEALQIQTSILGDDHPEVQETRNGIEFITRSQAKRDLSEPINFSETDEDGTTALISAMKASRQETKEAYSNIQLLTPRVSPSTRGEF